jgi:hypothetical protein
MGNPEVRVSLFLLFMCEFPVHFSPEGTEHVQV